MTTWHILTVAGGSEEDAKIACEAGGWTACYPYQFVHRKRVGKLWQRELAKEKAPLFGGYLFANLGPQPAWDAIRRVPGVIGYMMDWGRREPALLDGREVARVMAMTSSGRADTSGSRGLVVGDKARVLRGPFAGLESVVAAVTERQVKLTVVLFDRQLSATFAPAQIERA